jgi:hypothetical protein
MTDPVDRQAAKRIAERLGTLLQWAATQPSPVSLALPPGSSDASPVIEIFVGQPLPPERIEQFTRWLRDIQPIGSGAHALRELLEYRGVRMAVEDVAESLLAVDILNDIIAPGDSIVKNSLHAVREVANAYDLGFRAARIEPGDELALKTPFIANLRGERYVVVTGSEGGVVTCTDMGVQSIRPRDGFLDEISGFVFASCAPEHVSGLQIDYVDGDIAAFVWG